ncbi:hypothetical protein IJ750_07175 [bacterium]|nr:hypothetical protein [bacterium]
MRIQPITNKDNPIFGAKLKVHGNINDVSAKMLRKWNNKAKAVGECNDTITIHIGKKECKVVKKYLWGLIPYKTVVKSRAIMGFANIDGKEYTESLSYMYKDLDFNEKGYIKSSVTKFIKSFCK